MDALGLPWEALLSNMCLLVLPENWGAKHPQCVSLPQHDCLQLKLTHLHLESLWPLELSRSNLFSLLSFGECVVRQSNLQFLKSRSCSLLWFCFFFFTPHCDYQQIPLSRVRSFFSPALPPSWLKTSLPLGPCKWPSVLSPSFFLFS